MLAKRQKSVRVFVVKNLKTDGIIVDDVIETEPQKFKSIKFRHTFYKAEDFVKTEEEVFSFLEVAVRNSAVNNLAF